MSVPAVPTALTIAGSDSGGGAGIQADLKTFLACRVHGMSAITAVTVQNSRGVSGFYELPPQAVAEQIESVVTDIGVGAAKTGMLASAAIMAAIADTVRRLGVGPLVVDPVAASQHGDPLLLPDAMDALRDTILPLATLATPNLGEVRLLTGRDVRARADMPDAARALLDLGPRWVLIKGGHLDGDDAVDLLSDGTSFLEFPSPRQATAHTHGSGDTLAAAITSSLARGASVPDAVADGKRFITEAVRGSFALGGGLGPVGHFWRVGPWPDPAPGGRHRGTTSRPALRLTSVTIGAPDPRALARFYARLLGCEVAHEDPPREGEPATAGWAQLRPGDGQPTLNVEFEPDYVAPVWPSVVGSQQIMEHLDIAVTDLDEAQAWALEAGAVLAGTQPQPDVRVMLDPAGHPFCLFLVASLP